MSRLSCLVFVFFVAAITQPGYASPIIHPGDTIDVEVSNFAAVVDNSQGRLRSLDPGNLVVAADGSISMPVIGTVRVSGQSANSAAAYIRHQLARYVLDPVVSVVLIQQNQMIFLTGATTGTLPYLPGETLSSAIGQLRSQLEKDDGPSLDAADKNGGILLRSPIDLRNIVVQRDLRRQPSIDGESLLRTGQPGPSLLPGDTLIFANKPVKVSVRGEVSAPGPIYLYRDGTLEQALLQAGGPLSGASTVNATLVRNGSEFPLPLGGAALRQTAQNDDAIIVRSAPHVTVIGQVPTPGELTLKNGSTLLNALYLAGGPTKWANVRDIQVVHEGIRKSYDLTGLQHGDLSSNASLADGDVVYVPEGHRIDPTLFFQGIIGVLAGAYDASHL